MTTPRGHALAAEQIAQALREMHADDRALAQEIFDAADQVTLGALIRAYYADLDRSDRTPRAMLYVHIGMLCGLLDTWYRRV